MQIFLWCHSCTYLFSFSFDVVNGNLVQSPSVFEWFLLSWRIIGEIIKHVSQIVQIISKKYVTYKKQAS